MAVKAESYANGELDHIRDTLTGLVRFASNTRAEMIKRFDKQDQMFECQQKTLDSQQKTLEHHGELLERHGALLEQHGKLLIQHGKWICQISNDLDQFKHETRERFSGIENTLDKHGEALELILAKLS
ncbi:MAG: hypothetical protein ACR2PX_23885 [Endozoicomonas sp.]|uniref:hypothetical protein n=1 Tax=Endozoicomonas sp. TaxID=1892382 RepID=UPI003D9BEEB6